MDRLPLRAGAIAHATGFVTATLVATSLSAQATMAGAPASSSSPLHDSREGSAAPAQTWAGGGPLLLIEPFVGRMHFAEELGGERQELLGIGGGVEFTRHFALRGFYWRGVSARFDELQAVQSYGGEAQLTFQAPPLFTFLVAGVGQLGFGAGDGEEPDALPADRRVLILGGGLGLALGRQVRLHVSLRDYIARADDPEPADATARHLHNPLLSIGLTFALGGEPSPPPRRLGERQWERLQSESLDDEIERAFAERDRFMARIQQPRLDADMRPAPPREAAVARDPERTISIPVPAQGEIYIRYGQPGGVRIQSEAQAPAGVIERTPLQLDPRGLSPAELDAVVRAAVQQELQRAGLLPAAPSAAPSPAAPSPAAPLDLQLEQLERRLMQRIDELIELRLREREQRARVIPVPPAL